MVEGCRIDTEPSKRFYQKAFFKSLGRRVSCKTGTGQDNVYNFARMNGMLSSLASNERYYINVYTMKPVARRNKTKNICRLGLGICTQGRFVHYPPGNAEG